MTPVVRSGQPRTDDSRPGKPAWYRVPLERKRGEDRLAAAPESIAAKRVLTIRYRLPRSWLSSFQSEPRKEALSMSGGSDERNEMEAQNGKKANMARNDTES
jgi:hypothetical protein